MSAAVLVPATYATAEPLRRPAGRVAATRSYLAIFATCLRNQLAYVGERLLRGVFLALVLFIFLQLWRATFAAEGRPTIAGFTVAQMVWYLALTESIMLSRPRINQAIDREVRSGDIAYVLIRPYGYAGYQLAVYLGERLLRFFTTLPMALGLALLYTGPVPFSAAGVGAAAVTLALAMLIDFLCSFGIGLLAFWTEDTLSISLIYDRLVMLLGGMLLPLDAFPQAVAGIARALPFSALVYGPAGLALGAPGASAGGLLIQQAVTLAVAASVVGAIYRAALRRVNVNGG